MTSLGRRSFARRYAAKRRQPFRRPALAVKALEDRCLLSATGPFQHVFILSVDGLHQADVADAVLQAAVNPANGQLVLANIMSLQNYGVSYTDASTTSPSDSFPGTLAYLTGAFPDATGVFYDNSYSRTLFAPGSNPATSQPGVNTVFDETIDKNSTLLSGGGNFGVGSIDLAALPVNANDQLVYPHNFLQVNTIFNVAQQAGLYTAFSDKHPAYDIANGPSGDGVNELYCPEVNSITALYDPKTNTTLDPSTITVSTDVSQYVLVDASTDPLGPNDPHLLLTTDNWKLTEAYDNLKVQALINEIDGLNWAGTAMNPVPNLAAMNFQEVSVAEKNANGGIFMTPQGTEVPSAIFLDALQHTDASIGRIVAALKSQNLWNSSLLTLTAKHGQDPRVGSGSLLPDTTIANVLTNAGVGVAQSTADDVNLLWLQNQAQTAQAVAAIQAFENTTVTAYYKGNAYTLPASQVIDQVLYGEKLNDYHLGNPLQNSRTPDIIVTFKPGFIFVGNPLNYTFKNAEHGGFSPDDTQVPLIVASGGLDPTVQGTSISTPVSTTQIAVSTLQALGLNPHLLQGAVIDGTQGLPGLSLSTAPGGTIPQDSVLQNINHFVVIYQENWSFDSLYGYFPGANGLVNGGLMNSLYPQANLQGVPWSQAGSTFNTLYSYDPSSLPNPPPPLNNNSQIDPQFPSNLNTLNPYNLGNYISPTAITGDVVHRFWQEQAQINDGSMNQFLTWSDNPGLAMSYFNATTLPEGLLAQQYTMDDNFFHAAYGGSFLNHQFLVSATAPVYPNAPSNLMPVLDPTTGQLALNSNGQIIQDGKVTPIGTFGDQTYTQNYAVNTIFSANLVPNFMSVGSPSLLPSINNSNPNGPNYQPNIGDLLDTAGISWKWYSGGWNAALDNSPSNPNQGSQGLTLDPNFQWHHQPLAYYNNFAPWLPNGQRNPLSAQHLQDEANFFQDLQNGNLPAVSFIKPVGENNEHPGYTDLLLGQQHVADIVHAVQNSPDWAHTAIIITYDENGGRWDGVSPPTTNMWGDGTRVPAIIISPYARQGYVDHTQHDTLSILKTIEERFGLPSLNGLDAAASSLATSFQNTPHSLSIGSAYLQPDANSVGQDVLVIQGTTAAEHITVYLVQGGAGLQVQIDTTGFNQVFPTSEVSRIQIYGLGGDDLINVGPHVTTPAQIFTGQGNATVQAGGGPTVVVGGNGKNTIRGGSGFDILIGGLGSSTINAQNGQSILIAGTTNYGADPEALTALENAWDNPNVPIQTRVATIQSGVGLANEFKLTADTVHANGVTNTLIGGSGMDWYFASLPPDTIKKMFGQDVLTPIPA
jgi:phospholipase C